MPSPIDDLARRVPPAVVEAGTLAIGSYNMAAGLQLIGNVERLGADGAQYHQVGQSWDEPGQRYRAALASMPQTLIKAASSRLAIPPKQLVLAAPYVAEALLASAMRQWPGGIEALVDRVSSHDYAHAADPEVSMHWEGLRLVEEFVEETERRLPAALERIQAGTAPNFGSSFPELELDTSKRP